MDHLPHDPAILVSSINMLLRDEEFDTLESLCHHFGRTPQELKDYLHGHGFVYSEKQKQMRPIGYDHPDIDKDCIETAYSFFHQKLRVYEHSTLAWQRDDIECAIAQYADSMSPRLYALIAGGRTDFLRDHRHFGQDLSHAVAQMEEWL